MKIIRPWDLARQLSAVVGLCWCCGCYVGLGSFDDQDSGDPPNTSAGDSGDGHSDDEEPAGPEPLCGEDSLAPTRIWRLSDSQHANATRDLLGLTEVTKVKTPGTTADSFVNESELFAVTGPMASQYATAASDAATQAVASLDTLVSCEPAKGDEACAAELIDRIVPRAFRRPIDDQEREALLALYREGEQESFAAGVGLVIEAVLQAPSFLYRTELGAADAQTATVSLDAYELASAVSFLLLDSIPDDPLWAAAEDGSIADLAVLEAHVDRLLQSPRGQDNLVRIYGQWLGVPKVSGLDKSDEHYPEFDDAVAQDMATELVTVLQHLMPAGTLADLLTSRTTFVNERLAALYGIQGVTGEAFVEVQLPADERAGIMTGLGMMAALAAPEETSVVHRGLLVQELLMCNDLPAPPPGVDLNDPDLDGLDQRALAEYRAQEVACASCHNLIDPVGLTFEHYDPIGRFRLELDGQPVDASADVPEVGPVDDAVQLMDRLADDPQVRACVTEQLVTYALGRRLGDADECELEQIEARVEEAGGALAEPIRAVALSEAFRLRHREDQ
ncbi:MAG: DUF1592 domain-containing protein [Myxococcota bacterium]